jgi:L-ascorbate metabolism protein UlaG (beta-lactamase superfamily)
VIYVLELDGLRFAVMGDICQTKLSDAQLAAIGAVDVAFMIMFDAPQYGYTLERSQSILAQLQPKLIFPTHNSSRVVNAIAAAMGGLVAADFRYAIDARDFGAGPGRVVLLGNLPD